MTPSPPATLIAAALLFFAQGCDSSPAGGSGSRRSTSTQNGDVDNGSGGTGVYGGDGDIPTPRLDTITPTEGAEILQGQSVFSVTGTNISCSGPGVNLTLTFVALSGLVPTTRLSINNDTCTSTGFETLQTPAALKPASYAVFIDIGDGTYSAPESNRLQVNIRPLFNVTELNMSGVEQNERILMRAAASGINCDALPTMTLDLADGSALQTITAVACDEYAIDFDFSPTVAPGVYHPTFVNGNGLPPDQSDDLRFTVYEHSGLAQQTLVPGLHPSLASQWFNGSQVALIAAIDPSDSTLFFLKRSSDFSEAHGASVSDPNPRVTTSTVANEVRLWATDSGGAEYAALWASDTQVGVLWLDAYGRVILTSPSPIDTTSPSQLDVAMAGSFGSELAVTWRDGSGNIQVALIDAGSAIWHFADVTNTVGLGDWPRIAPGGEFSYDFTIIWMQSDGSAWSRPIDVGIPGLDDPGPVGEATLFPYGRVRCDFSPESRSIWVCDNAAATGNAHVLSYDGSGFYFPQYFGTSQSHPPSIVSEPGRPYSPLWVFMSFVGPFGETVYEVHSDINNDDWTHVMGRVNQPRDAAVPPDIKAYSNSRGDIFTWVAQHDGNVVLGTMRR